MRLIDADNIVEIYQSCADMFSDEELSGVETVISWIKEAPTICDIEQIRAELHATAEIHEDGYYYLRDKWVDEIIDKYTKDNK